MASSPTAMAMALRAASVLMLGGLVLFACVTPASSFAPLARARLGQLANVDQRLRGLQAASALPGRCAGGHRVQAASALRMVAVPAGIKWRARGGGSRLSKAFKRPTGALTVSLEFDRAEGSALTDGDLAVLSMQLRKGKAAALFTSSLQDLAILSKEQKKAKGDFPGPCPVVFYPALSTTDAQGVEAAAAAGADAIVLRAELLTSLADVASAAGTDVIWDVRSTDEMQTVVDADKGSLFLMPGADAAAVGLLAALPGDAVGLVSIDRGNDEISGGRALAKDGVKSLLVRQACTGDKDVDVRYANYAIDGLTSKANPDFQITGLSKSAGDGRKSFGASAEGRALQDKMSTQKEINHFHDKPGGTDFKGIADKGTTW